MNKETLLMIIILVFINYIQYNIQRIRKTIIINTADRMIADRCSAMIMAYADSIAR